MQVFNIFLSIIRAKFIAVIVGPVGIGLFGLLSSTISLLTSVTSFGLSTSSIKDIAYANEQKDQTKLLEISSVLNRLVWYTGGLGMFLTLVLSPLLSKLTFDSYDYTWSFILLSVTLFLGQLTLGKDAVLQGTRQLKWLASANMASAVISLLVTFPLYYIYGIKGIVPAMIVMSCMTLIVTQFFYSKLKFVLPSLNFREVWEKGNGMLKLGLFLSLSGIVTTASSYGVRIFITRLGGLEQVGLYSAGFGIINTYVGIVLNAMATDYYPRLAGVINDSKKYIKTVNQQGTIALIILGPIICIFIVFSDEIVRVLYSKAFLGMTVMMKYGIMGIFFRAASWLLGFVVLAKGSTKLFFWSEVTANIYQTILNCIFYYYWGLEGLGISFVIGYIIYLVQMNYTCRHFYSFRFETSFIKIFVLQICVAILALFVLKLKLNVLIYYFLGFIFIAVSTIISLQRLHKIIDLKEILHKITNK